MAAKTLDQLIPKPRSNFLLVRCPKCGNTQVIFNKAATLVTCLKCGNVLAEPTGGKARLKAKIVKVLS